MNAVALVRHVMAGLRVLDVILPSRYAGVERESGLLLGFGGSSERRLIDATRVLSDVLRDSA